ncbi:uncharacterized protein LOC120341632 [Styela clava]
MNLYIVITFVHLIISQTTLASKLEVESPGSSEAAKNQLQKIYDQTKHMRYGQCWMQALSVLQAGCRQLTDEVQRRIAYAFARCHLQASGRDIPECPNEKPISACTDSEAIPDIAFNAYTEFFTHTQQICFHLQNQAWHEATENTISRLADNSAEVATQLENSADVAKEMVAQQSKSLENQEILLQNEEKLKNSMEKSVLDVQRSHAETKAIISEQRALFSEVFDRVAVLQKTVLGEFSSIYTFGFYVGSTLMAYILTSTTRTSSARVWLFLILMMNAAAERMITYYYVNPIDGNTSFASGSLSAMVPELIYEQTWLCRQVFSGFALLVLLLSVCRYKDYNRINNSLLNEIKQQNLELQNYIKENIHDVHIIGNSTQSASINLIKTEEIHDESIGKKMLLDKHQSDIRSVATLSHRHEPNATMSDANTTICPSNLTKMTINVTDSEGEESDCTFRQSEVTNDVSDVSSVTSFMSVSTRSTRSRSVSARINSSRRSSTPLRDIIITENQSKTSMKRSRRKSSIISTLNDSVSNVNPPSSSVVVGGYSLRRRPESPRVNHSILRTETVEEFTSYVLHDLAERSADKRMQITQHLALKKS